MENQFDSRLFKLRTKLTEFDLRDSLGQDTDRAEVKRVEAEEKARATELEVPPYEPPQKHWH